MDAQQPSSLFRDRMSLAITPAQVIALGLVVASIGWAVWLLRDRPVNEEVELLAGMTLPSSEMAIMEAAFDRAQLTDHRTDGGRVWVPRSRQSAYMRALVDAEALPREFGGSLRRALEKNSPWQSRAVQDELLRVATQEELSLVICSMPGIDRAAVLYDTEAHHNLDAGGPAKTASVNVRTQPDMELDVTRIQAIRVLVSASIAGLTPERVAVTDLRVGRVYAGPLEVAGEREAEAVAAADPVLARKIAHEHHLVAKVRQALSFVKGATVDVSVEFGGTVSDPVTLAMLPDQQLEVHPSDQPPARPEPIQRRADANAPAEIRPRSVTIVAVAPPAAPKPNMAQSAPQRQAATDLPESIFVSIAIPETYFQAACRAAVERAGQPVLPPVVIDPLVIEAQETDRIRQHVLSLLPASRDPTQRRVMVTSFPVASPLGARRESAVRAARVAPAAVTTSNEPDGPHGLDAAMAAVTAGRFAEVPRQFWLAATSICVGLLAGFLWLAGGRRAGSEMDRMRQQPPRIDWSTVGESEATNSIHAPSGSGIGRAAVLLLALCACTASARAAGPEKLPAIAPLPEPLLAEDQPIAQRAQPASLQTSAPVQRAATAPTKRGSMPEVLPALPLDASADSRSVGMVDGETGALTRSGQRSDWKLLAAIGAAFVVVAAATMLTKRRKPSLPPDVFEVLGEGPLGGQHAVRVVRFGPKTLLVGVSAAGCQTLAEISDPQATACITAACRGVHPPIRPTPTARSLSPRSQPPAAAEVRGGEEVA